MESSPNPYQSPAADKPLPPRPQQPDATIAFGSVLGGLVAFVPGTIWAELNFLSPDRYVNILIWTLLGIAVGATMGVLRRLQKNNRPIPRSYFWVTVLAWVAWILVMPAT